MRLYSHKDRPFHMSAYPLERLPRVDRAADESGAMPQDAQAPTEDSVSPAIAEYFDLFAKYLDGRVAPKKAPVPDDPEIRSNNLKASAYFIDAAMGGVCELGDDDWLVREHAPHRYAFVFAVPFGREPERTAPGGRWIRGTNAARTDTRACEIAVVLAGYLRALGFAARGQVTGASQVKIDRLAVRAGIARVQAGMLKVPFLKNGFRLGVVTTEYAMACDRPLAPDAPLDYFDADSYFGVGGTRPGWADEEEARRPLHWGRYPMEEIKHVDEPTTLLIRDEIAQVPRRADFFYRARAGDLGERARREVNRFAVKHPFAQGLAPLISSLVPLQGARHRLEETGIGGDLSNPQDNADAIKALGYYLGADFVGICRAERWMYYSHDEHGQPLEPYHAYAVVMLLDQGFETMEGASGDDWISGSQSMRAYLRTGEIAGIMAAHCRRMGYSARTHTVLDSEVIHDPCILMAGLGEVSRIGDTLLNPFIGPRSKSVVFTTDLPLAVDKPIDFGLQDFCEQCNKCARECPCNAIPFGPKIMFNGYEIWKPDVEKCTKYRLTNMKGAACGRCMKMCPWNREDLLESDNLVWLAIRSPEARRHIVEMDDKLGHGKRNPVKRWWFDLEVVDHASVRPIAGVNERDLQFLRAKLREAQKLALYPPEMLPKGGTTMQEAVPTDRAAGVKLYTQAETPEVARERVCGRPVGANR